MKTLLMACILALAACGAAAGRSPGDGGSGGGGAGGEAGTGGSGGQGGSGGEGGTGGVVLVPRVESITPSEGPVGTEVIFHGVNLDRASAVGFNGVESEILDIEGQSILHTIVPLDATTGQVFVSAGATPIVGPTFKVNPPRMVPSLSSIDPSLVQVGQGPILLTAYGVSLAGGTVLFDGAPLATTAVGDALQAEPSVALLSGAGSKDPVCTGDAGCHAIVVQTPVPGGDAAKFQTSNALALRVVPSLHVTGAGFQGLNSLVIRFDAPLAPASIGAAVLLTDPPLTLGQVSIPADSPRALAVEVPGKVGAEGVTLSVGGDLRGADASRLVPATVQLQAYDALPRLLETRTFAPDCTATGLLDPSGMSASATRLYVTERQGNQVQVFTPAGVPTVFYGNIGDDYIPGAFSDGTPAGCPGRLPPALGALFLPVGPALEMPDGGLVVGDTAYDQLFLYLPGSGGFKEYSLRSPATLLASDTDVYVVATDAMGNEGINLFQYQQATVMLSAGLSKPMLIARNGTGDLQFNFDLAGGGSPSASWGPDPYAANKVAYVAEPGNHRVQRVERSFNSATGWIGVGHEKAFANGGKCCNSGAGPGQFVRPRGVAVLPGGTLLVIDEANGGRLQKFEASGAPLGARDLGFMPAGIALGPDGSLFIVESAGPLHRYVP